MIHQYKSRDKTNTGEIVIFRLESKDIQTLQGWGKKLNYTACFRTFDDINPETTLYTFVNFDLKATDIKISLEAEGFKFITCQYYAYNNPLTFADTFFNISNIFCIFEEVGQCVILGTNGNEYYVQNTLADIKAQLISKGIKLCPANIYIDGVNNPIFPVYLIKDGMGMYSNAGTNLVNHEIITKLFSNTFGIQYISNTSAIFIDQNFA